MNGKLRSVSEVLVLDSNYSAIAENEVDISDVRYLPVFEPQCFSWCALLGTEEALPVQMNIIPFDDFWEVKKEFREAKIFILYNKNLHILPKGGEFYEADWTDVKFVDRNELVKGKTGFTHFRPVIRFYDNLES